MHFTTIFAGLAALAASVQAAPSDIEARATPHATVAIMTVNSPLDGEHSTSPLNVPLGKLTHQKNIKITELEIARVYSNVPGIKTPELDQITCQMYKDKYGIQPGSAEFTAEKPALISTNSVSLGWVLCYVNAPSA